MTRTTKTTMTFPIPFILKEVEGELPAGDYLISTDEEEIEGLTWLAYRRVATFIRLPSISSPQNVIRVVKIDPAELEQAYKSD